jgi:serine/threonine protein kinase
MIGGTISHYRILERLGGGGMGVVYKGWDQRLERYAAIKFLSPHRSSSDDFKRRFAREARTASRLEHPNICTVFETDETDDGQLFIAMAFCEGESLKRKIQHGPLPLPEALSIAAQVAAGLAAAHDRGVVHRDVKPGNVMVGADGRVKIVDFGIARLADETRLTRTGDVMGTTAYIAPEQFLSDETDHRADLWSLGVVLYEMVTGRLPWSGGDERELIDAIVKRAPRPISTLRLEVPQELERIVGRALAKRPSERYQRAEELRADLLTVAALVARPAAAEPYEATVVEAPPPLASGSGPGEPGAITPPPSPSPQPPEDRQAPHDAVSRADAAARGTAGDSVAPGGTGPARGSSSPGAGQSASDKSAAGQGGAGPSGAGQSGASPRDLGTEGRSGSPGGPVPASSAGASSERRPSGGMIGRIVAHYRILAALGGGGMGVVYQAQDLSLERVVALKFLPPELTRDPDAKARFLQEARAASALDHPNICTIHEVGETEEGQLYLAMACYDGETLKRRLQRGRLPIDEALETAQQVARGLVKAHRHGIVHRDIKPANLMITADEIVKILDFGIAKLVGAAGLTRVGSSLGTPGYMSPEQARGEEVDPRTDVWSLGAVLYEMVTGRRPFRGDNDQAVLYALFNQQPEPVEQLRPDAPPELVQIIGNMLEKDPDRRYPTAAAALADLRALYGPVTTTGTRTGAVSMTGTTSVPALPRPEPRRRRLWQAGLAAAAVLGGLLAAYLALRTPAPPPGPSHPTLERLTYLEGKETFPSLSPDGKSFLYTRSVAGRSHIFSQRVHGANPSDMSRDPASDDTQPAFSPDGERIAFRSNRPEGGGIFIMGATAESPSRLTGFGYNPAWSADSKEIAFATESVSDPLFRNKANSAIWRIHAAGGEPQLVFKGDAVQPSWSPHGLRIAYWGLEGSQRNIWTVPAAGGGPTRVTHDDYVNWNPVWSPDGKYLYFASNRGGPMNFWRITIDEASGRAHGEPEPIITTTQWSGFLSFSQDGRRFAFATDDSKANIERLDFDPAGGKVLGPPTPVTEGSRPVNSIDASPDGKWIAYASIAPQEDLFVVHPDGTGMQQITTGNFKNRVPRWSPDSSVIAFYSDRGNVYRGWTIRPDGSDLRLISHDQLYNPVFSPDGQKVACNAGADEDLSLIDLRLPLPARRPKALPRPPQTLSPFSWSRDAERLLGLTDTNEIFTYSFRRRSYERIAAGAARSPVWLHDGQRLLYIHDGKLMVVDTRTGTSSELFKPAGKSELKAVCPSPDDRVLYTVRATQEGDIWLGTFPRRMPVVARVTGIATYLHLYK